MKKIKSLLLAATVLVGAGMFATSCGGEKPDDNLSVTTPGTISFSAVDTKEELVIVKTNVTDWTQVPSADWVVTEKVGKSLKVTVKENTGEEERTATITFSAGNASAVTVTVNQTGGGNLVENPTINQLVGDYRATGIGALMELNFGKEVKFSSEFTLALDNNGQIIPEVLLSDNFAGNKVLTFILEYKGDGKFIFPVVKTGITDPDGYYGVQISMCAIDRKLTFIGDDVECTWKAVSNTIEFPTKINIAGTEYDLIYGINALETATGNHTSFFFGDGYTNLTFKKDTPITASAEANYAPSFGEYDSMVKKQTINKIQKSSFDLVDNNMKLVRAK